MKKTTHKNSKDKKNTGKVLIVLFISSVLIGSFIYIDNSLRPTIKVLAETKALEIANRAINKAVAEIVQGKIEYDDLVDIKMDSGGKITMVQANTMAMNDVSSKIAIEIQDELKKIKSTTSYIPIGTALGSPLLAKYGPQLKVSIEPIGTVSVDFKTEFESSGINQTRHIIYLEANTQVKVVIPLITSTKKVSPQIPICETIIVGDVPQSYINIPKENVPDLVPNINSNVSN